MALLSIRVTSSWSCGSYRYPPLQICSRRISPNRAFRDLTQHKHHKAADGFVVADCGNSSISSTRMTSSIGVPRQSAMSSHHGRQSALPAPDRQIAHQRGHHVVEGDDPHHQPYSFMITAKSSPAVLKLSNALKGLTYPAQSACCEFVRRCSCQALVSQHAVQQVFRIDITVMWSISSLQTRNLECGCSATYSSDFAHLRGDQTKSRFHAVH